MAAGGEHARGVAAGGEHARGVAAPGEHARGVAAPGERSLDYAAEWLRRDPSNIPTAVEELLRYESPAPYLGRIATEDFELHGQTIGKGEPVLLLLGAANRDPEVFEDADRRGRRT